MQVSQNSVLIKTLNETPSLVKNKQLAPSVFGNKPAATPQEATLALQPLTFCFPQIPSAFWGFLIKSVIKGGLSKERIEYIVEHLTQTHHYATFTLADFFDIDEYIHELSPTEVSELKLPHKPLAQIYFTGKYRIVFREDAERSGYPFTPYESMAEREERERRADEARWEKEYQQAVEKGEIDPNAPMKSLGELAAELADNYKPK